MDHDIFSDITNEIYFDEIVSARKAIAGFMNARTSSLKGRGKTARIFPRFVFITDGTTIEDVMIPALCGMPKKEVYYVNAFPETEFSAPFKSETDIPARCISYEKFREKHFTKTAFILLVDSKKMNRKWFDIVRDCAAVTTNRSKNFIFAAVLVPPLMQLPGEVDAVAEREYDYLLETNPNGLTPEEQFLVEFQNECRKCVQEGAERFSLLRFDNLFGSLGSNFAITDIDKIVRDAFEQKEVYITKEDREFCFSCMYTRDAAMALAAATATAKPGHEYDITANSTSIAGIKSLIQQLYPEEIALRTDGLTYSKTDFKYHNFTSLKFNHLNGKITKQYKSLKDALSYMICYRYNREFDTVSKLTIYHGRLNRLKEAEIDILQEIDRICRKYDIKYFLAGGTCLGAIRNGKSIPWDDDLDIGMLREDFEVFRRVAPQELDTEKYVYSSPFTDPNVHYFFDKIRLRDTYFSTFYSGKFLLDDGVFVDVIVYDQTTTNKLLQKLQIRLIIMLRFAIYLRWHNYVVKRHRRLAKLALPFLRLVPFSLLHKMYDKLTMVYWKKKNAKVLLDGGAHIHLGGFDKETLDCDMEYVPFDGMENAPIPSKYPGYLTFAYGPSFRPEPPLSSRIGAHKLARIDLGKYIESNDPERPFRGVDLRGELFEGDTHHKKATQDGADDSDDDTADTGADDAEDVDPGSDE